MKNKLNLAFAIAIPVAAIYLVARMWMDQLDVADKVMASLVIVGFALDFALDEIKQIVERTEK